MDIKDALIRLRDDLKEWTTNNILELKESIPSSINGLATEDYVDSEIDTLEQYVKDEVARLENTDDIVDSVEEMTNTNKQYVLSSTNTWWQYKTETLQAGGVLPDVNNAIKWDTCTAHSNKRYNSSGTLVDAPGCATFEFIPDDAMLELITSVNPLWVRFKGCSMYSTTGNPTSLKVSIWSLTDELYFSCTPYTQILTYVEDENGINNEPLSGSIVNLDDNTKAPVYAIKLGYYNYTVSDNSTNSIHSRVRDGNVSKIAFSVAVNFANTNPITEADLENVYITFNEPIISYETKTTSVWYDTGIEYNPNADNEVVELQTKVTDIETKIDKIENRVETLESKSSTSGGASSETSTLPDYWKTRLNKIGTKIENLQMENGMDTLQFLWCSDIHGVPGTSPSNTTYIGEIGRYMMDKYNIPFFMVSGDIMSQASHSSTNSIWAEYDKLIPMLSPINNEEFLAIRGNHDGAWGSPMEYNGQANQYYHSYIGDKALFNAFMRRQTLDSHRRVFGKDGMYFYVDYHNYRIYLLNGHTFGDNSVNEQGQAIYNGFKHPILGSEQIQWVADTLNTVEEDQQVLFVCHAQLNQQLDFEVFRTMLNHYKNRTSGSSSKSISGTYWGTDAKYSQVQANFDFTDAKGSVVGWFNGHIHTDSIKTDLFDNLPIFTITTAGGDVRDKYYTDGTLTRVKGTVTETAIDIVTITSEYIYFTRIGSGYDRKYNRLTKEVTIDYDSAYIPEIDEPEIDELEGVNLAIPNATNTTDTDIWVNGYRFSSSGLSAEVGTSVSNKIPIQKGDTIKIGGVTLRESQDRLCVGATRADTGEEFISVGYFNNGVINPTKLMSYKGYENGVYTFFVESDYAGTINYFRFAMPTPTDFNKVKVVREDNGDNSELIQGEITDQITWKSDTRLSSSNGGYSTLDGCYASSDIECSKDDIIRIYGASKWHYYSYIAAFSDTDSYLGFISMENHNNAVVANNYVSAIVDSNNTLSITILHENVSYIRVANKNELNPKNIRVSRNLELKDLSETEHASFVNLISTNVSDYTLNKKFSGTSIVDGGGYYLTPIYKFSNEKTPYLNIEGAYGAGATKASGIELYKVAFYEGSTCTLVEYSNNMGLPNDSNSKQSLDMSKYTPDKYDGIQLLFHILSNSSVTTNDIPIDGTVKAVLAETPDKFIE